MRITNYFGKRQQAPENPFPNTQTAKELISGWFTIDQLDDGAFIEEYKSYGELLKEEGFFDKDDRVQQKRREMITEVIKEIRNNPYATRIQLQNLLKDAAAKRLQQQGHQTQEALRASLENEENRNERDRAIDQAVRLFLAVNSRDISETGPNAPVTPWARDGTNSLACFMSELFHQPNYAADGTSRKGTDFSDVVAAQTRLTHRLTAANFQRYTNVQIVWTDYLPDHLTFDEEYKLLRIFRHRKWLEDVLKIIDGQIRERVVSTGDNARDNNAPCREAATQTENLQDPTIPSLNFPIPRNVIIETIATLEYLFPPNTATLAFLTKEQKRYKRTLDVQRLSGSDYASPIRLQDFRFYHDRMIDVAYEFSNPPTSFKLVWKDTRNPIQFWTFWLGLFIFILTLMFGTLASILAGLQYGAATPTVSSARSTFGTS